MPLIDSINAKLSEIARERDKIRESGALFDQASPERQRFTDLAAEYDRLMAEKMKPGHMYEVDINADPKAFLDWDRPLKEQPSAAEQFMDLIYSNPKPTGAYPTGRDLYDAVARKEVNADWGAPGDFAQRLASERLREAGVPGVRYLDQGSRGIFNYIPNESGGWTVVQKVPGKRDSVPVQDFATKEEAQSFANAQGSSNYAIFDPEIIEIRRKYGLLPPVAVGGGLLATGSEPPI